MKKKEKRRFGKTMPPVPFGPRRSRLMEAPMFTVNFMSDSFLLLMRSLIRGCVERTGLHITEGASLHPMNTKISVVPDEI